MTILDRKINFGGGPACMPLSVLQQAQEELLNYKNTGMSIMELSHRSSEFLSIMKNTLNQFRTLLNVPNTHEILLVQGGATLVFSMIPFNFNIDNKKAVYVCNGIWSKKAYEDGKKILGSKAIQYLDGTTPINIPDEILSSTFFENQNFTINDIAYLHFCDNETVSGFEFQKLPTSKVPIVCDMSSNICSKEIDVSKYACIYAGFQKNLGTAGGTVVIVDKNYIGKEMTICPTYLSWKTHIDNMSMYNTPSVWSIYICNLILQHYAKMGGMRVLENDARKKSKILYNAIDNSDGFYYCKVPLEYRSRMNVTFVVDNGRLDNEFQQEAEKHGFVNLSGHRSVGGCRISLYNSMEFDNVEKIIQFMHNYKLLQQKKNKHITK